MSQIYELIASIREHLIPWLPSLFTLLGWSVVNWQNNTREQRKEARSAADRCKVLLRDASKTAIQYWSGQNEAKDWQVRALFEELEVEIGCLPQKNIDALLKIYSALVDAALGYNFGTATFKPVAPDHPVFKEITLSRQRLLSAIEISLRPEQPLLLKLLKPLMPSGAGARQQTRR